MLVKTGLMERLVAEFCGRGLRVSTLKHAHHSFDVDHPGKDSHRHRMAGRVTGSAGFNRALGFNERAPRCAGAELGRAFG